MDSVAGDDLTLPVDFDASTNLSQLPDVSSTGPAITAANFELADFTDANMPAIQKVGSGRMSPIRAHTMKDYEQQISDLKKENFSLKLRIYFMEERLQPNFEENDDIKTNIELKVEVESLKKDLMDKQLLLVKASNAVESLVQEKEAIAEKLKEENRKALEQLRERLQAEAEASKKEIRDLNEAMKQMQKDLNDARQESPRDAPPSSPPPAGHDDTDSVAQINQQLTKITDLQNALKKKDDEVIKMRSQQDDTVKQLQGQLQGACQENEKLKAALDNEKVQSAKQEPLQEAYLEQETRLKDVEKACGAMTQQLEDKDKHIKGLEDELQKANKGLESLGGDLAAKEAAQKAQESNAMKRDKAIQGLTEMIRNKDKEIKQLCDQVEDHDTALSNAREAAHKADKNKYESLEQYQASMSDMETKLDEAKTGLQRKHLENERLQKAIARKSQELSALRQDKAAGDDQLGALLDEKDAAVKELKDELKGIKAQGGKRTDAVEQHYQGLLDDAQQQLVKKQHTIHCLTKSVEEKDRLVQEYMELARNRPTHEERDSKDLIIQSLRDRLKQRDKAVEDAIEEKFHAAEVKDGEIRKLRVALRERDRELEKINSDLLAADDKNNQLEDALQQKDAKNRQLRDSLRSQTKANKDAEASHTQALQDKEATIEALQNELAEKNQSLSENSTNQNRDDIIEQLNDRIKEKEKRIQEMLAERNQMAISKEKEINDLLSTLKEKDKQIRALHDRHNRMMASKNDMLKELQKELNEKELEIQGAEDTLLRAEQEQAALLNKMRNALAEKDKTIEKLLNSGQEKDRLFWEMQQQSPPPSSSSVQPSVMSADMMRLKGELTKAKKNLKEKDALIKELGAHRHLDGDPDEIQSLKDEINNKNKLLSKAKDTIDALQRDQRSDKQLRIDMSKLRRQNIEVESELQAKQDHIDALVHAGKVKDNIIQELRLQVETNVPVFPQRNGAVGGDPNDNQLQQAFLDHLTELSHLSDALKSERQLYVNITHQASPTSSSSTPAAGSGGRGGDPVNPSESFQVELAAVQALRKQLEEGIKRNKEIRNNLLRQQQQQQSSATSEDVGASQALSAEDPEAQAAEMSALNDQLEASRRSNASLQMRLDKMKQRADGVGSDVEPVQQSRHTQSEEEEDVERSGMRSIPGQEEVAPSTKATLSAQRQLEDLQAKLTQSEHERDTLTQQLEAVMLNQTQPDPDGGGPVVPILKQQLDQAKTLLMEKDRKLQEKEQQNQALRHHLGIGPISPITPGRSMLAGLRQENARLQQELHDKQMHAENLEHQVTGLQTQCAQLRKVKEALHQQLETRTMPDNNQMLADKLGIAEGQLNKTAQENVQLRRILGIGPDVPVDNGRIFVDNLQQENAMLRGQLEDAEGNAERLQVQLDIANKELEEPAVNTGEEAQLARLKKQLRNATALNELLKRHIELNSAVDGNQSFNPELIVDMAREIEHLKEELDHKGDERKVTKGSEVDGPSPAEATSAKDRSTINAYKKELRKVEAELDETKQQLKTLQRRLKATEGTVHRQADKIKRYRREMHNSGMAIPCTPERARSDSNLPRSFAMMQRNRSGSDFSILSIDSTCSSTSMSPAVSEQGLADLSFSEYGDTDDATQLQEQIGVLKNQLQRLRRAVRHLQRRLRAAEGSRSRSPSPARSLNDSWFELTANEDAFEKLHVELANLKEQLNQTNAANMTLQGRNLELHMRLSQPSMTSQDSWEGDTPSNKQHTESQTEMDFGSQTTAAGKEQLKKLNKELQDRRNLNKKLRDLLADNQKVAEETGKDLERLAGEVQEKNATIRTLRKQLRQALAADNSSKLNTDSVSERQSRTTVNKKVHDQAQSRAPGANDQMDSVARSNDQAQVKGHHHHHHHPHLETRTDSAAPQKDQWIRNRTETNHLRTKLRETESLSQTLKTELEIYRKVLDSRQGSDAESERGGAPVCQQSDSNEALQQHLEEIRALRKVLEESISVNDRLRERLEAKLAAGDHPSQGEGATNIDIHETYVELTEEISSLKEQRTEREHIIVQLKDDIRKNKLELHRLNSENHQLKEQLEENTHLTESLRFELNVYEHLEEKRNKDKTSSSSSPRSRVTDKSSGIDLTELLREIRHLRIQLERSIDTNNALRLKLEEMMKDKQGEPPKTSLSSVTVTTRRSTEKRTGAQRSLFQDGEACHPMNTESSLDDFITSRRQYRSHQDSRIHQQRSRQENGTVEEPQFYSLPPGSMSSTIPVHNRLHTNGPHLNMSGSSDDIYAVCTLETYRGLLHCVEEGQALMNLIPTKLTSTKTSQDISKTLKYLLSHLEECSHLLTLFWKSKLPSHNDDDTVLMLKKRLSDQETLMREALEKLSATNRMKEGMEQAIIDQLYMTHTVLQRARGNLESQPRQHTSENT